MTTRFASALPLVLLPLSLLGCGDYFPSFELTVSSDASTTILVEFDGGSVMTKGGPMQAASTAFEIPGRSADHMGPLVTPGFQTVSRRFRLFTVDCRLIAEFVGPANESTLVIHPDLTVSLSPGPQPPDAMPDLKPSLTYC